MNDRDDRVAEASEESFPASDPPSFTPLHAGTPDDDGPEFRYGLLTTDAEGRSHWDWRMLAGFVEKALGGAASPLWQRTIENEPESVRFFVLPVGWTGEWHESPGPQWVVALSGRWFIETATGTRVEMGPGDLHLGLDQGTVDAKGHRSGQLGDEPCVQLIVRYRHAPDLEA